MNEDKPIKKKSLEINLDDNEQTKLIDQELTELKKRGYNRVTVDIQISTRQELENSRLNVEIFKKIKDTQELPDWVVIKLMLAAGKLKNSGFNERLLNE